MGADMHGCMMGFCPYLENYHDNGAKKGKTHPNCSHTEHACGIADVRCLKWYDKIWDKSSEAVTGAKRKKAKPYKPFL